MEKVAADPWNMPSFIRPTYSALFAVALPGQRGCCNAAREKVLSPFQGFRLLGLDFPGLSYMPKPAGRCPGLPYFAPLGLTSPRAERERSVFRWA